NGPTVSNIVSFQLQPPPGDIFPPVITVQPKQTSANTTSVVVNWETDEPGDSVVEYALSFIDLDAGTGSYKTTSSATFSKTHPIEIGSLIADRTYFARVMSSDPAGNGPTTSGAFTFTTTAAPDILPPVITAGPTATSILHDKITV